MKSTSPQSYPTRKAEARGCVTQPDRPTLLTTAEAADLLRIRPNTLEIWRWKGCGPRFVKLGRAVRYHTDDITAFIQSGFRNHTSENEV